MKLDGNTSGRRVYVDGTCDGKVIKRLWSYPDGCKHCPHATRIRLKRVPKWVHYSRDDGYGKDIPITDTYKRRMRDWLNGWRGIFDEHGKVRGRLRKSEKRIADHEAKAAWRHR